MNKNIGYVVQIGDNLFTLTLRLREAQAIGRLIPCSIPVRIFGVDRNSNIGTEYKRLKP